MVTRKPCRVATAQRLRGLWPKKTLPIVADKAEGQADGVAEAVAAVEKGNLAEGVTVPESKRGGNSDGQTADEQETTTSAPKTKKGRKAAMGLAASESRLTSQVAAQTTRPSLLNLAAIALAEAGEPMNCQQMVEKVLSTGLWQTKGRTPWATLYSAVIREIATKGEQARFRKVDKGKFASAAK